MAASILRSITWRLANSSSSILCSSMKMHSIDPAQTQKTTVTIMNKESDFGLMIDAFSIAGFRLNNSLNVIGPMAIFPRSVLHWSVRTANDINEDALCLFFLLEPKIDILVLGVGDFGNKVNSEVYKCLQRKKINIEVLPTEQACATFNFLNAEKRYVAAGLIPPNSVRMSEENIDLVRRREVYDKDNWI